MAEKALSTPCFKAYDIRGRVPDELNEELAYRLGLVRRFPVSGEINCRLADPQKAIATVEKHFTEPLLRLNVESWGGRELMERKTREILDLLEGLEQ